MHLRYLSSLMSTRVVIIQLAPQSGVRLHERLLHIISKLVVFTG
jgi:hypothetical protein